MEMQRSVSCLERMCYQTGGPGSAHPSSPQRLSVCPCLFLFPWPHQHRTLAGWWHHSLARLQNCSRSIRSMRPQGLPGIIAVCASLLEKMAACKPERELLSQTDHSCTLNLDFRHLEQWANECHFISKLPSLWNFVVAAWVGWYTF